MDSFFTTFNPQEAYDKKLSNRDPRLPHNQLHPRSLESSGTELDEAFADVDLSKAVGQTMPGEKP